MTTRDSAHSQHVPLANSGDPIEPLQGSADNGFSEDSFIATTSEIEPTATNFSETIAIALDSSTEDSVRSAAITALGKNATPASWQTLRALVERADAPMVTVLNSLKHLFETDRETPELRKEYSASLTAITKYLLHLEAGKAEEIVLAYELLKDSLLAEQEEIVAATLRDRSSTIISRKMAIALLMHTRIPASQETLAAVLLDPHQPREVVAVLSDCPLETNPPLTAAAHQLAQRRFPSTHSEAAISLLLNSTITDRYETIAQALQNPFQSKDTLKWLAHRGLSDQDLKQLGSAGIALTSPSISTRAHLAVADLVEFAKDPLGTLGSYSRNDLRARLALDILRHAQHPERQAALEKLTKHPNVTVACEASEILGAQHPEARKVLFSVLQLTDAEVKKRRLSESQEISTNALALDPDPAVGQIYIERAFSRTMSLDLMKLGKIMQQRLLVLQDKGAAAFLCALLDFSQALMYKGPLKAPSGHSDSATLIRNHLPNLVVSAQTLQHVVKHFALFAVQSPEVFDMYPAIGQTVLRLSQNTRSLHSSAASDTLEAVTRARRRQSRTTNGQ